MGNVKIRFATKKDVYDVYGHYPSQTMRAYAAELDGKTVAVSGLYYFPDQIVAFSKILPGYEKYKTGIAKGALKVLDMLERVNLPVFAIADKDIPGSGDFLLRCGFDYVTTNSQGEVYLWQKH